MKHTFRTLALFLSAAAAVFLCGCKETPTVSFESAKTNSSTYVVTIGMESSKFAGTCPGAGLDARRMTSLLSAYSPNVVSLSSETATKAAVVAAMQNAVAKSDLFILYYSGHGGSDRFWDTGSDEDDGKDEYLCLYDTYLRDNDIWQILSQSKGRVVAMFDACHSKTMFRNPVFTLSKTIPLASARAAEFQFSLLAWSGCPDNTYSYGSSAGGEFTNALLRHFSSGKSYDALWKEIAADEQLKRHEIVQRTTIGSPFGALPVFQ